jgi:hypothetical protein
VRGSLHSRRMAQHSTECMKLDNKALGPGSTCWHLTSLHSDSNSQRRPGPVRHCLKFSCRPCCQNGRCAALRGETHFLPLLSSVLLPDGSTLLWWWSTACRRQCE